MLNVPHELKLSKDPPMHRAIPEERNHRAWLNLFAASDLEIPGSKT
jgi:hypothetical protein